MKTINKQNKQSKALTHNKSEQDNNELTNKQQAFVDKIMIEGMTPSAAYLAVYPNVSKKSATSAASRLLKHPNVITALSSLSKRLEGLATIPKHKIVQELKEFLELCKAEGNKKYFMEALDMINKMMGNYQHNTTVTKISLTNESLSFGGWNPDSDADFIEMTPTEDTIEDSIEDTTEEEESDDDIF